MEVYGEAARGKARLTTEELDLQRKFSGGNLCETLDPLWCKHLKC